MSAITLRSSAAHSPAALAAALHPAAVAVCLNHEFGRLLRRDLPAGDVVREASRTDVRDAEALARLLVRTILDAAGARAVTGESETNRAALASRIANRIRRNDPVAVHMLWSPKKHWVVGEESAVDLAELAALDTLHAVHAAVCERYQPGMVIQLEAEDIEFEFMEGSAPDVVAARERYIHGLRRLIEVLGLGGVLAVSKVSEQAASEAELECWRAQMAENYRALELYWYESEREGIDRSEHLSSYATLRGLGWSGPIPVEMRRHYLHRLGGAACGQDPATVAMVLRNLAGILLHHQKGLGCGRAGSEAIKFSFVPPAAGAPAELLTGRVDLRFVSRRICSRVGAAGPWSTKGYLRWRDGRLVPAFAGWQQTRAPGTRFVEGRFLLVRGGEAVELRADRLLE